MHTLVKMMLALDAISLSLENTYVEVSTWTSLKKLVRGDVHTRIVQLQIAISSCLHNSMPSSSTSIRMLLYCLSYTGVLELGPGQQPRRFATKITFAGAPPYHPVQRRMSAEFALKRLVPIALLLSASADTHYILIAVSIVGQMIIVCALFVALHRSIV